SAVGVRDEKDRPFAARELLADLADRSRLACSRRAPDEGCVAAEGTGNGGALARVELVELIVALGFAARLGVPKDAVASWVRPHRQLLDPLDEQAKQHRQVALK